MAKKILIALLGIIVLLVIVGFFLPGTVDITKTITINAPAQSSFEEVNNVERWKSWSYWGTLDPGMKVTYGDTTTGVGAKYSWEGDNIGKGTLTIVESIPYSSIKTLLDFKEQGTATGWYTFETDGDITKVTEGFHSEMGYNPLMRWLGVTFLKSEMEKAFDHDLAQIKELAEAKPKQ